MQSKKQEEIINKKEYALGRYFKTNNGIASPITESTKTKENKKIEEQAKIKEPIKQNYKDYLRYYKTQVCEKIYSKTLINIDKHIKEKNINIKEIEKFEDKEQDKCQKIIANIGAFFDEITSLLGNKNIKELPQYYKQYFGVTLTKEALHILRTRYGINDDSYVKTVKETSKILNIPEEKIDEIEQHFLDNLKETSIRKDYLKDDYKKFKEYIERKKEREQARNQGIIRLKDIGIKQRYIINALKTNNLKSLLNKKINEIDEITSLSSLEKARIIDFIHSYGLKFSDEIVEVKEQEEIISKINLTEIPQYEYSALLIKETKLSSNIIKKLTSLGIIYIDQIICFNKVELEKILGKEESKIVNKYIKSLGYKLKRVTKKDILLKEIEEKEQELKKLKKEIADLDKKFFERTKEKINESKLAQTGNVKIKKEVDKNGC